MTQEINLDPDNWEELNDLGNDILSDMLDYLRTTAERKVWQSIPDEVKQSFNSSVPWEPMDGKQVYAEVKQKILPYPQGNIHPRFWGWVNGSGTPMGLLAELIIATMNINTGGREHIANYVERQVISWMIELFEFPDGSSGLLTSGCSISNLIGITIARNEAVGFDVRKEGIQGIEKPLVLYGSGQMHSSIQKAVEILGLGSKHIRLVDCNDDYTIDTNKLVEQINRDIEEGYQPFCVVGNIATVNSGAIDDIHRLREICDEYSMWLHLDGAFGAFIKLSEYNKLVDGINLADSLAFDFHKWFHVQYDVGAILVNNERVHRRTFSLRPSYLASMDRGLASGGRWFSEYGLQLSRSFRSLKVWMLIKVNGIRKYGDLVTKNIKQARYFARLVDDDERLELIAPVISNVVCFRYNPGGLNEEELETKNKEILIRLHERGKVVPSFTRMSGKYCLRIAITNHRSRFSDFDILREEVIEASN